MSPSEASVIKSSPIRKIGWYLEQYCILTLKIPLFLPSVWRRGLQHKKFQEKGVCSSVQSIVLPLFVGPPLKISFGHIFVGLFLDSPWKVKMLVLQSCLTRCYPMDCIPPGSSVHGISQARIVEWVAIPSPGESSWPRDQDTPPPLASEFITTEPPGKPIQAYIPLPPLVNSINYYSHSKEDAI